MNTYRNMIGMITGARIQSRASCAPDAQMFRYMPKARPPKSLGVGSGKARQLFLRCSRGGWETAFWEHIPRVPRQKGRSGLVTWGSSRPRKTLNSQKTRKGKRLQWEPELKFWNGVLTICPAACHFPSCFPGRRTRHGQGQGWSRKLPQSRTPINASTPPSLNSKTQFIYHPTFGLKSAHGFAVMVIFCLCGLRISRKTPSQW